MANRFANWIGRWSGIKQLWLNPESEAVQSEASAEIKTIIQDKFLQLSYGWQAEEGPQVGRVILPAAIGKKEAHAVWLDSWHTGEAMMVCEVAMIDELISMQGTYPAGAGPDWGWRLELSLPAEEAMLLRMINISPDCEECLAVQMDLKRQE